MVHTSSYHSPPLPSHPVKDYKKAVKAFVIQKKLGPETEEIQNNFKAYHKMTEVTEEDWEGRKVGPGGGEWHVVQGPCVICPITPPSPHTPPHPTLPAGCCWCGGAVAK